VAVVLVEEEEEEEEEECVTYTVLHKGFCVYTKL
jgi:hypothetical protein